jgi:hypothetical protein
MVAAACGVLLSTVALSANDPVLEWNSIMLRTMSEQTPAVNPVLQSRFAAITQVAVYEAVNAIEKDYDPYLGSVDAPRGASAEAAAIAAAHAVLKYYFQDPVTAKTLDDARAASLAGIPDGIRKQDGIAVGEAAAAAMIALRSDDGSAPLEFYLPPTPANAGEWLLTPGCPAAGGILLNWPNLRPFAIVSTDQFRAAPPPALTSRRYTRDYLEVLRVGGKDSSYRPQDREDVANLYAKTGPTAVWNSAASQVAVAQGRSLSDNARAFALLNMAINDAQAAVFETKYFYKLWRPETAIRAGDTDGNPFTRKVADFAPLISTPCFPSYASGHGASSNAARAVLERLYGARHHFITISNPAVKDVVLQYSTFQQMTRDIDDARIYGGIHFRFDQEAGEKLGRQVGAFVHRNTLRHVHGQNDDGQCN